MLELIISYSSFYWISYSLRMCSQISTNSSNVVFFDKNCRKSTENVYEQWEITETNNWIELLTFDDKSQFIFSQPVP